MSVFRILSIADGDQPIGLVVVFGNCPGDRHSISGRVIPKTQKVVLDTSLLKTQHYKVRFKGKVEQSRERSSALPFPSVLKQLKRELYGSPRLKGDNFTFYPKTLPR